MPPHPQFRIAYPDRVVYPATQFTRQQVLDYYLAAAPHLLPHLANRPVTLKRYPDVAAGPHYYEKDAPAFTPAWVKTFGVWRRSGESQICYIVMPDTRTLAWVVSIGTLEIHPFLCRAPQVERPTMIVFDLDPGQGSDILTCAKVAFLLRDLLRKLELQSFAKVSGSKGLQVYVPLNTDTTYAITQPFARTVAELLQREHPALVVAEMEKAQRKGKVFIDWSQNADYKTTVGVYSLRAKRHHPYVSLPVTWDELQEAEQAKDPKRLYFEAGDAIRRFSGVGDLFSPVLSLRQQLPETFTRQLGGSRTARTKPVHKPPARMRPSAQGSRRRFLLRDARGNQELLLESEGAFHRWTLPRGLPKRAGQSLPVERGEKLPENSVQKLLRESRDHGVWELILGSAAKGWMDLFLAGERLRGEWILDAADKTIRKPRPQQSGLLFEPIGSRGEQPPTPVPRSTQPRATGLHVVARSTQPRAAGSREPRFVTPMECRWVDVVPPADGRWLYELKLDGYRAVAVKRDANVELLSRYGRSLANRFPAIVEALRDGKLATVVLDGEIVAIDEEGKPSFRELQNSRTSAQPIVYYVFDLLHHDGRDLQDLPLEERKGALRQVARSFVEPVRLAEVLGDDPGPLLAEVQRRGLEGVVAKRRDSLYESGKRSGAWVKYRAKEREEFVIGGYMPGKNYLDAVLVGQYRGPKLYFVKKLRNGFVPRTRAHVFKALSPLRAPKCPFVNLPEPPGRRGAVDEKEFRKCVWVKPKLKCEVDFVEWTEGGRLRHAEFRKMAEDKQ